VLLCLPPLFLPAKQKLCHFNVCLYLSEHFSCVYEPFAFLFVLLIS
jgi:hypothetical protein